MREGLSQPHSSDVFGAELALVGYAASPYTQSPQLVWPNRFGMSA